MTEPVKPRKRRPRQPCRRCITIRLYLMLALPMVALMAFFPSLASGLGEHVPPPEVFGVLVPMVAIPAFVIRLVRWHRAGRP